jgi:hypothetical protein
MNGNDRISLSPDADDRAARAGDVVLLLCELRIW